MFLVGLTGGIASGKSTVADRLVHHGVELIDADEVAREVVVPGRPAYDEIIEHFGAGVLDDDGFIDRAALARIVFADDGKRALLNAITHPRIMDAIASQLELLAATDGIVVLDVPLLVETGAKRQYDAIVVVATEPKVQIDRLVALRGMDPVEARARVQAQAPLGDKLAVATHVIWNEDGVDELIERTDDVHRALVALAERKAQADARAAEAARPSGLRREPPAPS